MSNRDIQWLAGSEMSFKMTGIILAGGKNTRMGLNKALLRLHGRAIIEHIIEVIEPIFSEVLLVSNSLNDFKFLRLKSVRDIPSADGSLAGIYSGLVYSKTYRSFFFACDMPFINPDLIKFMMGESRGHDVIIPQGRSGLEPLHAVYSKDCINPIKDQLDRNNLKIVDFFSQVKVKSINQSTIRRFDPGEIGFFNINSRADYQEALRMEQKKCRARAK